MPVFSDYPSPPGNKPVVVADFDGPSSYTAVTTGTPPTGGFVLSASQLGLAEIEHVVVSASDNGQYGARVIFESTYVGRGARQVRLQFFTLATGAEVAGGTNLSARRFRAFAVGK